MKQKILILTALLLASLGLVARGADAYIYENGAPSRQIIIDKKVKPDEWTEWYDNLSSDVVVFTADDKIDFKVLIKNSGENDLSNIEVIDYLPDHVNFVSGPEGAIREGREVKWTIDHLNPGEEKEFTLQVQVVKSENLPEYDLFCVVNRVKATAESGESDEDTAQICVETRILGAAIQPEAGAELWLLASSLLGISGLGLVLSRKRK